MTSATGRDRGSAIVDFALVGGLLTVLFVALLQVVLSLHVRSTLIDAAARGAAYGALAGAGPDDAATRARELIAADLGARYARQVVATRVRFAGLETIEVSVRAPLPVLGLLGPARVMTVRGHAVAEPT